MIQTTRDYQHKMIDSTRDSIRAGRRRPLLVAPTGSGKTHMAEVIIRSCEANGKHTLFLAPRRELIYQAHARLTDSGISAGIIMAGVPPNLYAKHQVASFDTLYARAIRKEKIRMPKADVVIVDEAHLSLSKSKQEVLEHYKDAIVIGLTATPTRSDGTGLGVFYDDIVNPINMGQLMDEGYLVRPKYFAPTEYDLKAVKMTKADYVLKSLDIAVNKPKLVGDVYTNWKRLTPTKSTVIFAVSRKHSRNIRDVFVANGIKAEHLDGETELEEREDILKRVASGETQVLCNVFVATYGLDIPRLECCVICRPTKSLMLYLQMVGRVLRTAPNKEFATVIDHTGVIKALGFVTDDHAWKLNGKKNITKDNQKEKELKEEPKPITCEMCTTVFSAQRECPSCGHEMVPKGKPIPTHKANLTEIVPPSHAEKERFYSMLKYYQEDKGYSVGWTAHKFKDKFKEWPRYNVRGVKPEQDVINWVRHTNIKRARSNAQQ